jgi:hypothetical protein
MRDDCSEEEGSEQRVNANAFGCESGQKQSYTNGREHWLRGLGLSGFAGADLAVDEPEHSSSDEQKHEGGEGDGRADGENDPTGLGVRYSDDECEETPGSDVVHGGASEGENPETRSLEVGISEDAREDWKRGDGHGYADEESKRSEGDSGTRVSTTCESRIDPESEGRSEKKRRDDAGVGDGDGSASPLAQQAGVEFEPDEKHEKDDSDLSDDRKIGRDVCREKLRIGLWSEPPEERWSEEHACNYFAHDWRLMKAPKKSGEEACGGNDYGQSDEDMEKDVRSFRRC